MRVEQASWAADSERTETEESVPLALRLGKWDSLPSGVLNNTVSSSCGDQKCPQRSTSEHQRRVISYQNTNTPQTSDKLPISYVVEETGPSN